MRTPVIGRVAMTIGSYASDQAVLSLTLPPDEDGLLIGLSVAPYAALNDHQVLSMKHLEYQAVQVSSVGGTDYGPVLGHVANYLGHAHDVGSTALEHVASNRMRPFPGRYGTADGVLSRAALRGGLEAKDAQRLFLNNYFPGCAGFTGIPLRGGSALSITVKRLLGSTSLTAVYAWVLKWPAGTKPGDRRLCDGRKLLVDYPYWMSQKFDLAAAANSEPTPTRTRLAAYDDYALRVLQFFATGYSDTSGTIAHDSSYLNAIKMRVESSQGRLHPNYLDDFVHLREFAPQFLQQYDCLRDPQIIVPRTHELIWSPKTDETAQAKDLHVTAYGVLRDQDAVGDVADVE